MDSNPGGKPKVLLLKKLEAESPQAVARLEKALGSFCSLETLAASSREEALSQVGEIQGFQHIFFDISLATPALLDRFGENTLTFFRSESFLWNNPKSRESLLPLLSQRSCLVIDQLGAADLLRLLHSYLNPGRGFGVAALMEKGSLIIGDKVQTMEAIGELLDKLVFHLKRQESALLEKTAEIRLVMTGLLSECFRNAAVSGGSFPTVGFELSCTKEKLAFYVRFPCSDQQYAAMRALTVDSGDPVMSYAWANLDHMLLTRIEETNELDVLAVVSSKKSIPGGFRTLLMTRAKHSVKKDAGFSIPKNYKFSLLTELRNQKLQSQGSDEQALEEIKDEFNKDLLPEPVVKKLFTLEEGLHKTMEASKKKDEQLRDLLNKLSVTNKELAQKRTEMLKHLKDRENIEENWKKKTAELEKKLELFTTAVQKKQEQGSNSLELQGMIHKLEADAKAMEKEKSNLQEKLIQEQKRITAIEQKYGQLIKEFGGKEKEIQDLKATLTKMKKEQKTDNPAASPAAANAGNADMAAKIKEYELRESALKQKVRELTFKVDNNDKNIKAIESAAAEKIKLMERKLEAGKQKELDLLKKIDELAAALKKASKAA